jgi:hypothetical protein
MEPVARKHPDPDTSYETLHGSFDVNLQETKNKKLFSRLTLEKSLEDGGLENLDDLQLASPLHLKSLEFRQALVEVEHSVAFLQLLTLLLKVAKRI